MKPARLSLPLAALVALLGIGAPFGLGQEAKPASASEPPAVTPKAMQVSTDLSQAFRAVSQKISPSVVSIRVEKTIKMDQSGVPNDLLRRFFRNFGNDSNQGSDQGSAPPDDQGQNENQNNSDQPPGFFGYGGPGDLHEIGTGSGVIMDSENGTAYILTNNHVADDTSDMTITLSDGRVIKGGKLVGADSATDLAVVRIDASGLTAAKWGDTGSLKQGDWVLAFGSPFGFVGSMTHGIISALHRQAGILGPTGYENFIQTDAPINPGNSGGPLVNLEGEVVGINTAIASRSGGFQGIGFAIPADMAKPIYDTLKEKGKVVRGWLGIAIASVSDLTEQAKSAGYSGNNGVLVKSVMNDSPASGKLEAGDVITSLNKKDVHDSVDLRNSIAEAAPGTEVTLGIVRDGKQKDVQIKLGEQPENVHVAAGRGQESTQTANLGMRVADASDDLAQRYGFKKGKSGAVVTQVAAGSPAAMAGVHAGDLITRIDGSDIANASQARDAFSKTDLKKGIRLYVSNRQGSEYLFLQSNH